jgi:hypothetical protein
LEDTWVSRRHASLVIAPLALALVTRRRNLIAEA